MVFGYLQTDPCAPRARGGYRGVALLVALALTAVPALADVHWKNGAVSKPVTMQPAELVQALSTLADRPDASRVVIHFNGPVQLPEREKLEAGGIELLAYLGGYAYFAKLDGAPDARQLLTVSELRSVEAIDPANKLHPDLASGVSPSWSIVEPATDGKSVETVAVNVFLHRDVAISRAATLAPQFGGELISELEPINAFVAHVPADRVKELAAHDEVMFVEPPMPLLQELNDSNRSRTQSDVANQAPYNLDGTGVTVLVYDGGQVLSSHGDLAGRTTIGASDSSGLSDHATHVACTVGGDGSGNASMTGMAPGVDVVSYGFQGGSGFLYTNPGDMQADYSESVSLYGTDLSNNSIGSNVAQNGFPCSQEGNYGATGALIDEIVRGSLGDPYRIVWANGNERGNGRCGTGYGTTPPPACAKNHMTVGALNSNNDTVTSFTSWGPCDDGRMKPDVSAPGCQSNGDGGVSSCSSGGGYNVKCGTSMASPTAAGVAAMLLQQHRISNPSEPDFRNSTLRAVMAQTAVDLVTTGPDYQTGFGSIRAVPAIELIQEGRYLEDQVAQGEIYEFTLEASANDEVEVTIAWDDPSGTPDVNPVLVNDLDLRIIGPGNTVYMPWTLDPGDPDAAAVQTQRDSVNNIEQVRITGASAGTYRVQIEGFNVAEGPSQWFSAATSHEPLFCESSPTFSGLNAAIPGSSCGEIQLSWLDAQSNCNGSISYNIYRSTDVIFTPQASNFVAQVSGTSSVDMALEPGQMYHYVVRANDSISGEDANTVIRTATAPVSPDNGAPIFTGIQAASGIDGCGNVALSWGPALETCNGPVEYEIHRSVSPLFSPGPTTMIGTTFGTGFVDTSIPADVMHTYIVRARDAVGNVETNVVRQMVTTSADVTLAQTSFEPSDAGWTLGTPNDATDGTWAWGDPEATAYQPGDDATVDGANCWITGVQATAGNGDVDGGTTTLLSSVYDLSGSSSPTIHYARYFTNDQGGSPNDPTDTFRIDISDDNGQSWTSLEELGGGTPLDWVPVSLPLPGGVSATDQMRFRFTASDLGAGSLVEAGIDDFALIDEDRCNQCGAPPTSSLCEISIDLQGDDVVVDWSANPVGTRAVVYHVGSCDTGDQVKLGSSDTDQFLHEDAALSDAAFNYRVTFVDDCGVEVGFCGADDCP